MPPQRDNEGHSTVRERQRAGPVNPDAVAAVRASARGTLLESDRGAAPTVTPAFLARRSSFGGSSVIARAW